MKDRYLKAVSRALAAPRDVRQEILRDLAEIFAAAAEHGESAQQVAERLGPPARFADSAAESFGIDNAARRKRRGLLFALFFLAIAICTLGIWAAARLSSPVDGVIGQVDAMTGIQLAGGADPLFLLPVVGGFALLFAAWFLFRALRKRR